MAEGKHLMAVRLDQDDYEWLKRLAEATTGGNTSLALRRLVKAARTAGDQTTTAVSHVIQPKVVEEVRKPAFVEPKPTKREPMPDPSNKVAYQRWLRNNR